jgi:hypothetical protein
MIRYHDFSTGNNLLDDALENYLMRGYQPGGFLTAVLANDLFMAVGRADHWNKSNLHRIVNEIQNEMTPVAYGSYAAVKEWCYDADGRRSTYSEQVEKSRMMDILSGKYVKPESIHDDGVPF